MKKMMYVTGIITAFMLLMPLAVLGESQKTESTSTEVHTAIKEEKTLSDTFRVLQKDSGEITEISAQDYVFGVVCAEMPALYHKEALKAQAVAAYTYACYKREQNAANTYDVTTDFNTDQSFKTKEKVKADWGDKAEEYTKKLEDIVKEVANQKILYKEKPILAVYHAVSAGQTYSAKEIWGKEIAYLKGVPSAGDKLASDYTAVTEFTENRLKECLAPLADKKDNTPIISSCKATSQGLVESVKVYGEKISGSEVRTALSLPSTNFTFEKNEEKYIFTSLGYGHGVGMSQNGADYMAKQGYTYKEILTHYYKGVTVK